MPYPLSNNPAWAGASPLMDQTPRQRVESVLNQLPPAGSALSAAASQSAQLNATSLVEPLQRINSVMRPYGVEFHIEDPATPPVIRITDRETREVIRQIPAEEAVRLAERLDEVRGRLFATRA